MREWLGRALDYAWLRFAAAHGVEHARVWKHITLTLQRDASDADEHSPAKLKARVRALQASWRTLWRSFKEIPGAAGLLTIELAGTGHVHAHALVLGPSSLSAQWIAQTVGAHSAHCSGSAEPFVKIQTVSHEHAINELAKYHSKVPSALREAWLAGHATDCMHPSLAARWEVATYRQRLQERYGTLREVPLNEAPRHGEQILLSAAEHAEADKGVACGGCGCARWTWAVWPGSPGAWVALCWAVSAAALARPLSASAPRGPPIVDALADKDDRHLARSLRRARTRAWWAGRQPGAWVQAS